MPIFEMTVVLLLFAAAAVLLATEIIPIEVTALCIVVVLAGTGIMTTAEALQGFASEAIVVLACVMILAHRLSESGATSGLSARMVGQGKKSPAAILVRLMASAASLSSVFSNTSTTAVMMPIAIDAAKKANTSPGRFLMPMAFASIMGGSATLIGTSANMAANGVITRMGLEPFRLFEFFWIGLTVSVAGIVTFVLLGNRVVPTRVSTDDSEVQDDILLAGIVVPEGSKAIDTTVKNLGLDDIGATPLAVDSEGGRLSAHPNRKIHEGDYILLRATNAALARLMGDKRFQVDGVEELSPAQVSAQAILLPGSRWIGMSVAVMRRQLGQDVAVIGVKRAGYQRAARISLMRLRAGDILQLVGKKDGIARIDADVDIYLMGQTEPITPTRREGLYTLSALMAAIVVSALGVLPLSIALLAAVLSLVLARRLTLLEAFALVSWRILILIGGMSSLGLAMLQTGAAEWLAGGIILLASPLGITAVLIALSALTVVLTQPLSNAAAALTVLPIAIAVADGLGVDARPLAVIVTLSASLSFIAPLEPALLLVYGKGNYRLRDFILAGVPLTIVSLTIVLFMVPMFWPL